MAAITYNDLVSRVPPMIYATNSDLVAAMPQIIGDAEEFIVDSLDHDLFQSEITALTVGASPVVPEDNDDVLDLSAPELRILEVRAIRVHHLGAQDWPPLERRDIELLRMLFSRNVPGRPRYYGEEGKSLRYRVFPYPDKAYSVRVTANVAPDPLSSGNQSNALAERFGRALLKATCMEAASFMKDWESMAAYERQALDALGKSNMQMARRRRDETERRPVENTNAMGR